MSWALQKALKTNGYCLTNQEVLWEIRALLKGKYSQSPGLTGCNKRDFGDVFIYGTRSCP